MTERLISWGLTLLLAWVLFGIASIPAAVGYLLWRAAA